MGWLVGLTRIELVTSSLSGTRSNQLSYKPNISVEEKWNSEDACAKQIFCSSEEANLLDSFHLGFFRTLSP